MAILKKREEVKPKSIEDISYPNKLEKKFRKWVKIKKLKKGEKRKINEKRKVIVECNKEKKKKITKILTESYF